MSNAPLEAVTLALHGCAKVPQVVPVCPLPCTTVDVLPAFWSCSRRTARASSSGREHVTVPRTTADPSAGSTDWVLSIVSVTTVKSVNSKAWWRMRFPPRRSLRCYR